MHAALADVPLGLLGEETVPELLAELFSSRVRATTLALLLPRPHLGFSLTELSRRLDLPLSSLQHECYKLTRLGLLQDERVGNARLYRPNPAWPLLDALTALVVRAVPLEEALQGAVERIEGLEAAWVAHDPADPSEAVYLVLIGNLGVEELDGIFDRARVALQPLSGPGRVELAYFRPRDWGARLGMADPFAAHLDATRTIDIVAANSSDAQRDSNVA